LILINVITNHHCIYYRTWSETGQLVSLAVADSAVEISPDNTDILLKASDSSNANQVIIFEKGILRNPGSGKLLNINDGKVKGHWIEDGADTWELGINSVGVPVIYRYRFSGKWQNFHYRFTSKWKSIYR
jgi:hypothetical protein